MIIRKPEMDEWRHAFLLRLRLRDVPGARIGEALAEVETHCADGGQTAHEAFGDPVAYADALADGLKSPGAARRGGLSWSDALSAAAGLAGVVSLLQGAGSVAHGANGYLSAGHLLGVLAGVAAVAAFFTLLGRSGQRRVHWPSAALTVVFGFLAVSAQLAWDTPLIHAPGWLLLGVGMVLVAVAWYPLASGRLLADRIVDPRTGAEPHPVSPALLAAFRWGLPVMLLCAVVIVVLLRRPVV